MQGCAPASGLGKIVDNPILLPAALFFQFKDVKKTKKASEVAYRDILFYILAPTALRNSKVSVKCIFGVVSPASLLGSAKTGSRKGCLKRNRLQRPMPIRTIGSCSTA